MDRIRSALRAADSYQQRTPALAVLWGVQRKFSEDQASNLASLIAYYAFFSIFPLLLAATTVLGYVLQGDPGLRHTIDGSWVGQFPIIGTSLGKGGGLKGNGVALAVGVALALWSGFGVAKMAQHAFNTVYDVPMVQRPNFLAKTARAAGLIATVGVGLIVSTFVGSIGTGSGATHFLNVGIAAKIGAEVLTVAIDVGVFLLAFRWLTVRPLSWRETLPGATTAAIGWFVLQAATTFIINHKIEGSKGTYGEFAAVIALLSWFYLASQVVLYGAELNVVLSDGLWPRGLLDRPQTTADYEVLQRYAERTRYVRAERVHTDYPGSARPSGQDAANRS